jgi:hypothetical protein
MRVDSARNSPRFVAEDAGERDRNIARSNPRVPGFGLDWPYYLRYASGARNETHNF